MYLQTVRNEQKKLRNKKNIFVGILKATAKKSRIRIRFKMSRIRNIGIQKVIWIRNPWGLERYSIFLHLGFRYLILVKPYQSIQYKNILILFRITTFAFSF
jgi:hypothetical protein